MRRRQFSLRFLILGITVCALLLMACRNRPPRSISIEVTKNDKAIVRGNEIELTSLANALEHELFIRKVWFVEPVFEIRAEGSVSIQAVTEAVQIAQLVGADKVTFATLE